MSITNQNAKIGLAIIGCGDIGQARAQFARSYSGIGWIGVCDINRELAQSVATQIEADFVTSDASELLSRSEVTAAIIATNETAHYAPVSLAIEHKLSLFIEKPLAVDFRQSAELSDKILKYGIDAVMGYTQRFRHRFLVVKEKLDNNQIGQVSSVSARGLLNRTIANMVLSRANDHTNLTPMVASGTHMLDMCLWLMQGSKPKAIFARSTDKIFGSTGSKDTTIAVLEFDNDAVLSINHSWVAPENWPGGVYGMQIGIIGTQGVIDIEDMHRDVILASSQHQPAGYKRPSASIENKAASHQQSRNVDFLTSIPFGQKSQGEMWGPIREETFSWFQRLQTGVPTPHTTAQEGHANLALCMAIDLAAKTGKILEIPDDINELANQFT
ncbi:Gfo/Idh/MocA family oxidoreductase [Alphaproteobacteria bacterium]|nr:Gfo/Idh/MocA family oxidoreductase [Alphaproteobacteria bacterium]MDA9816454.1 Gfo/Idh/MocA family oxidoreductase [Alphaproteobacteria bacterium]MDC3311989.1 Gfo/Idh/MocA family oxidoreductase [Alphaproteobacteria bacterium]